LKQNPHIASALFFYGKTNITDPSTLLFHKNRFPYLFYSFNLKP